MAKQIQQLGYNTVKQKTQNLRLASDPGLKAVTLYKK